MADTDADAGTMELSADTPLAPPNPSHPNRKICTHIAPIPLPADDCDRTHSMHAALSSLAATTSAVDATMDSLLATTDKHRRRIVHLERRMAKFRQCLIRLDEVAAFKRKEGGDLDDRVCMVFCPDKYEVALRGMEAELAKVRDEMNSSSNQQQQRQQQQHQPNLSSSDAVRSAADAAVQQALMRDVQLDNGQAVPSDAWLDHASMGLGVGRALEVTNEQRSIPPLLGEDIHRGESDYQRILDTLVLNHDALKDVNNKQGLDRLESWEESPGANSRGGGGGDDESVYSVTSQMSGISIASSASTRMTAGQRRRWQKQQKLLQSGAKARTSRASSSSKMGQIPTMLSTHPEAPSQIMSAVAGRQQSFMGSQPYLCEVFHDSYGIGSEPARGLVDCSGFSARGTREGGTEFYPPSSHIPDLLVFNTTRNSYGLAANNNKAVGAAASPKSDKPTGDGNTLTSNVRSVSPAVAARKGQLSRGESANKQSLTHLVFKADAHNDSAAKMTLDLPASLPQGLSG